jgi:transposase
MMLNLHCLKWRIKKMNVNSQGVYLTPFQRQLLKESMKEELPNAHRQRLEIMMLTDNGKTQAEICRILGCSTATASRWIQLTKAGLAHNYLDCPVGRPKIVTDEYIESLQMLLQGSPRDYGYPFKAWTISWLSKHLAKEMGIEVSVSHLKRVMRELGLSTRSKARQENCSLSSANILISDLPHTSEHLPDKEFSEINLLQIKLNSRIYG